MSSDPAVRVQNLCKVFPVYRKPSHRLMQMLVPGSRQRWYREFEALRGLDFTVPKGQTVGIVGRNGSGKSTLLQIICGTLTPSKGTVEVNGRVAALLELGAGFNPEFTGRENAILNATVLGLSKPEIYEKLDDILAFADIGAFVDQPVKTYSSGMYVRLAFAVAINVTPDILIVDEALSVGDEAFQRKCFARIEAIRDAGATVLFVSHSASTVVDLCDRALLLDQGELLADGGPKFVVSQYQKMLYAPADRMAQVRMAICSSSASVDTAPASTVSAPAAEPPELEAHWDDGLVPDSTVIYENRGARIIDPHLTTLDGRRVNVVAPGGEYVFTYQVTFDQAMAGVRCGMMVRTVTGIELAGAATSQAADAIPLVERGAELQVRFRFRCLLAPGAYFLNAGVLARLGEGEEFVDRRVDVAMFRVMPVPGRLATGIVDLCVIPELDVVARRPLPLG